MTPSPPMDEVERDEARRLLEAYISNSPWSAKMAWADLDASMKIARYARSLEASQRTPGFDETCPACDRRDPVSFARSGCPYTGSAAHASKQLFDNCPIRRAQDKDST